MGFFEEHKKQIMIGLTILLLSVSFLTLGKKTQGTILDNALGFLVTPFQKMTTTTGNYIKDTLTKFNDNSHLAEENKQLLETIENLEAENKRLLLYAQENEKLSELLNIAQKYPNYETTGTQVIAKDPGNWYDIFLIDKGTKDGITANMVLIDSGGLVGHIIESAMGYSKVQSILDNRSSVPAMSLRTNDLGVVRGDYTLMNDGLCIMEYIDADAEIIEGDEIVTSYLSEIYPPGICIGYVKEIKSDSNGLTKYAIIEPEVDFKHLDTMLIINQVLNKKEE